MPKFQDATGYLFELRDSIGENWFSALVDYSLNSSGGTASPVQLESLWQILHNPALYVSSAAIPQPTQAQGTVQPIFVESVSDFIEFKKLSGDLALNLDKQITLVFGRNGSGKSSLCQALKILANQQMPDEPLHNVHAAQPSNPSFSYKFRHETNKSNWSNSVGFGIASNAIKYFDSKVALRNITDKIEPEISVEISAFRLELFEFAGKLINSFQQYASLQVGTKKNEINQQISQLKLSISNSVAVDTPPFDTWQQGNSQNIYKWLTDLAPFDEAQKALLSESILKQKQLTTATSDDGIKSIRAQSALLDQLCAKINQFINSFEDIEYERLVQLSESLNQKRAAHIELSKNVFPEGVNHQLHVNLISAANSLIDFNEIIPDESNCPLCQQVISKDTADLFKSYSDSLTSNLMSEIKAIELQLENYRRNANSIRGFVLGDLSTYKEMIADDILTQLSNAVSLAISGTPANGVALRDWDQNSLKQKDVCKSLVSKIGETQAELKTILSRVVNDTTQLKNELNQINIQIGQLNANKIVDQYRANINGICETDIQFTSIDRAFSRVNFTNILRNITIKGKEAHSELVLDTFTNQLNDEYISLCGMNLEEMGVRLASKGAGQDITVTPQVGSNGIHRVLSEGEQKIHALAVFMCEAKAAPHQALVFDDPVTSFDYNYVSNFCIRIKDHARNHPNTQVLILTHSWDFFVNLQTTLNQSGLNNSLSVQVLEDCCTVSEYIEDWEQLKTDIESYLNSPNEPSASAKEHLSGLLRRLIEKLTNQFVFNNQRHQYKIKSLPASNFPAFTKIVPLEEQEANDLRDLYSNLSPPEHDDPRNFYSNKTKLQFRTWYDNILLIQSQIEGRRP